MITQTEIYIDAIDNEETVIPRPKMIITNDTPFGTKKGMVSIHVGEKKYTVNAKELEIAVNRCQLYKNLL